MSSGVKKAGADGVCGCPAAHSSWVLRSCIRCNSAAGVRGVAVSFCAPGM